MIKALIKKKIIIRILAQIKKQVKAQTILFNRDNDIYQFEIKNTHINPVINDIFGRSTFTSRNNATIKVPIIEINNRYGLIKPSKQCFNDNINAIN